MISKMKFINNKWGRIFKQNILFKRQHCCKIDPQNIKYKLTGLIIINTQGDAK